jgi:pilus assembly protein CpaB
VANSFFSGKNSILIPLVLAGLGVFLVIQYLKTKEGELGLSAELVPVMVANIDIPAYTKLDKAMIHSISVPKKFLQPSALRNPAQADKRVTLIPLLKGEQILATMVSEQGQAVGLALKIRQGFRAVSVGVDAISGVSGLLKPGDKVDVIGTFDLTKNAAFKKRAFTLMQNIVVLAVGENLGTESLVNEAYDAENEEDLKKRVSSLRTSVTKNNVRKETVTLLVDPGQVQKIILTQEIGKLSLALCPVIIEGENAKPEPISGKDMLGIEEEIYIPRAWGEIRGAARK